MGRNGRKSIDKPKENLIAAGHEKPVEIDVQIYRCHVVVVMGWTLDEIVEWGIHREIGKDRFVEVLCPGIGGG